MNREARLAREHYGKNVASEWQRLGRDAFHALEWGTTWRFLERHLPRRGVVLDAGGGPGRYTLELARRGYEVVLLDLTPENLAWARRKARAARVASRVRGFVEGSITDLSRFESSSFDAVLCLGGPLSHVHPRAARARAVRELVRVAKPGAPLFLSVFGRFAVLARGIQDWYREYEDAAAFERLWKRGDDDRWCGRHFAHFFTVQELRDLLPPEVEVRAEVGLEGLASAATVPYAALPRRSAKAHRNWVRAHAALCTHPSVVDTSAHILLVARRRREGSGHGAKPEATNHRRRHAATAAQGGGRRRRRKGRSAPRSRGATSPSGTR